MTDEILFGVEGCAGFVTLNRPAALNALTEGMVRALAAKLDEWETDAAVRHIVIRGTGGKAFCAGGDIRQIYDDRGKPDADQPAFFWDEYRLNARIKAYPKPYIALIDGIVMGGGVGVSVHGSHRVGTEFTMFAMPETGIGFFPDVGGTHFLPRLKRKVGVYCALSAGRLKQADAHWSGVLSHATRREDLPALEKALSESDDVDKTLAEFAVDPGPAPILEHIDLLEAAFGQSSVSAILDRLGNATSEWAGKTAAAIRAKSPTSVMIALEQMRRGAELSFNEAMALEFRIVNQMLKGHDFYEGIRAVLIDRDNSPEWLPNSLGDVDSSHLAAYFEEPDCGDLDFV